MPKDMIIAVDFDATIAHHNYPDLGRPVLGAFHWLKEFQAAGARLILLTMRSDTEESGPTLTDAVTFCRNHGIEFWAINENPEQKKWTKSPKVYAHKYIDDAGACIPLIDGDHGRKVVDWSKVGPSVLEEIKAHYEESHKGVIVGKTVDTRSK